MSLEALESDMLSIFLKDKKKFVKFSRRLNEKHFRNEVMRWTFMVLKNYFERYRRLPTIEIFKNELMKSSMPSNDKKIYFSMIKKLLKKKTKLSLKYLKDNIEDKIEKEDLLLAIEESVRNIEKKDIDSARKKLLKTLMSEKEEDIPVIDLLKDWKSRQMIRKKLKQIPVKKRFISTPYSAINSISHGIQISEAATVGGLTNVGKSIMMGEFGANSLLEGLNVLHFTLENTGEQTAQRYDSRLTTVKYDILKLYDFKKSEKRQFEEIFDALYSALDNDIKIQETSRKEADFSYIDKKIQALKYDGFDTEFLIIDSCDIMKSLTPFKEYRLDRASIYWDFKDYCKIKRLPGLTSTHLGKDSKGRIATMEDLAEAYDKARILDMVYIMSQTVEDEKNNIVRFTLNKNRDGPVGATVDLFRDSSKMRFLEIIRKE